MKVEQKVSRRRLVKESTLTAGAVALATQLDLRHALAQNDAAAPATSSAAGPVLNQPPCPCMLARRAIQL